MLLDIERSDCLFDLFQKFFETKWIHLRVNPFSNEIIEIDHLLILSFNKEPAYA